MAKQREIQVAKYKKYVGAIIEVMVEGYNDARSQWIGRTSQNKTLNFTAHDRSLTVGSYVPVTVTRSFPNSLVGELRSDDMSEGLAARPQNQRSMQSPVV